MGPQRVDRRGAAAVHQHDRAAACPELRVLIEIFEAQQGPIRLLTRSS